MRNVYMSHPVSAPTREGVLANLENAKDWVVRLVKDLGVAVTADWITIASRWDESMRETALKIDCAQVERCDAVVMVGGRASEGMIIEANHARTFGIPVHDWTHLGYAPPSVLDSSLVAELARSGSVQGTTRASLTGSVIMSRRARSDSRHLLAELGRGYGVLCKAILQKKPRVEIQASALFAAAVAVRLLEEGDSSFDDLTDVEAFGVSSSPSHLPDPKTIEALGNEIARARAKFPGSRFMLAALGEEFGEACEALLEGDHEHARREALQVACCAVRLLEEGDPSMPAAENPDGRA